MPISFKYKILSRPEPFPNEYAPAIPVQLKGSSTSLQTTALVDSGADFSAIPYSMAEVLGLDLSGKRTEVGGLGGNVPAVLTKMQVMIQKGHFLKRFNVPVYAVDTMDDEIPVLLGRVEFFDRFKVTFDERNKRIYLTPYQR